MHKGVQTPYDSLHWKLTWEKNPLPHWGMEPVSAVCWSDALPPELHPHPHASLDNAMTYSDPAQDFSLHAVSAVVQLTESLFSPSLSFLCCPPMNTCGCNNELVFHDSHLK